ncbi:MAG: hypothetical protein OCD02_00215 [Spirochaetaceae bacterium]
MELKRVLGGLLITIVFISTVSCNEKYDFKVEGENFTYQEKTILLGSDIEEVCKSIDIGYEIESIPKSIGYYFDDYRLNFYVPEGTKKIGSVMFQFYNTNDDFEFDFLIDEFNISTDSSWNFILNKLNNEGMSYSIKERKTTKSFIIKNHRITSIKYYIKDLNKPYRLQFR